MTRASTRDRLLLDRYRRVAPEGRAEGAGISGVVVEALDTVTGLRVAVKLPNPNSPLADQRSQSVSLGREAEALRKVGDHPAVRRLVDHGTLPEGRDLRYLVTEWAEGTQLSHLLRRWTVQGQTPPQGMVLEILRQLAHLVEHAHTKGVVNNDIDAGHLFWDAANRRLSVIDWANAAFDYEQEPHATKIDDLEQFGQLMCQILTGSTLAVAAGLSNSSRRGWSDALLESGVPEGLQTVLLRCVAGFGEPRYADASELHEDISSFLNRKRPEVAEELLQAGELLRANTTESLQAAGAIFAGVRNWDPHLEELGELEAKLRAQTRAKDEQVALVETRALLHVGNWVAAKARIEEGFGHSPESQDAQEYWLLADLLTRASGDGSEQGRLESAVASLLDGRKEEALDKLLLAGVYHKAKGNRLIPSLLRSTGRRLLQTELAFYRGGLESEAERLLGDLHRRDGQMGSRRRLLRALNILEDVLEWFECTDLEKISEWTVPDQAQHYKRLQVEVSKQQKSLNRLDEPLEVQLAERAEGVGRLLTQVADALQQGHAAALSRHDYQEAAELFLSAFRTDAGNPSLYALAELSSDLSQVLPALAQSDNTVRNDVFARDLDRAEQGCIRLAHDARYASAPCQAYIDECLRYVREGRRPISTRRAEPPLTKQRQSLPERSWSARVSVQDTVRIVRDAIGAADLSEAQAELASIPKSERDDPSVLCISHTLTGYRHLFGHGERLPSRQSLEEATQALQRARPVCHGTRLVLELEALIEVFETLAAKGLDGLPQAQQGISRLLGNGEAPPQNLFVETTHGHLQALERWRLRTLRVNDYCLGGVYQKAREELAEIPESEERALSWLGVSPEAWRTTVRLAHDALGAWRSHEYSEATELLGSLREVEPVDRLHSELLTTLLQVQAESPAISESLQECAVLLKDIISADDDEAPSGVRRYNIIRQKLRAAAAREAGLQAGWQGATELEEIADLHDRFVDFAVSGNIDGMEHVALDSKELRAPLTDEYEHILQTVRDGMSRHASQQQIVAALDLAPYSDQLQRRRLVALWRSRVIRWVVPAAATVLLIALLLFRQSLQSRIEAAWDRLWHGDAVSMDSDSGAASGEVVAAPATPREQTAVSTPTAVSAPQATPAEAVAAVAPPADATNTARPPLAEPAPESAESSIVVKRELELLPAEPHKFGEYRILAGHPSIYADDRQPFVHFHTFESPHDFWYSTVLVGDGLEVEAIMNAASSKANISQPSVSASYGLVVQPAQRYDESVCLSLAVSVLGQCDFEVSLPPLSANGLDTPIEGQCGSGAEGGGYHSLTVRVEPGSVRFRIDDRLVHEAVPPPSFAGPQWQVGLRVGPNMHGLVHSMTARLLSSG